jgi:hypothetical protein
MSQAENWFRIRLDSVASFPAARAYRILDEPPTVVAAAAAAESFIKLRRDIIPLVLIGIIYAPIIYT